MAAGQVLNASIGVTDVAALEFMASCRGAVQATLFDAAIRQGALLTFDQAVDEARLLLTDTAVFDAWASAPVGGR